MKTACDDAELIALAICDKIRDLTKRLVRLNGEEGPTRDPAIAALGRRIFAAIDVIPAHALAEMVASQLLRYRDSLGSTLVEDGELVPDYASIEGEFLGRDYADEERRAAGRVDLGHVVDFLRGAAQKMGPEERYEYIDSVLSLYYDCEDYSQCR